MTIVFFCLFFFLKCWNSYSLFLPFYNIFMHFSLINTLVMSSMCVLLTYTSYGSIVSLGRLNAGHHSTRIWQILAQCLDSLLPKVSVAGQNWGRHQALPCTVVISRNKQPEMTLPKADSINIREAILRKYLDEKNNLTFFH